VGCGVENDADPRLEEFPNSHRVDSSQYPSTMLKATMRGSALPTDDTGELKT